jgi:hypothetical protein
MARLVSQAKKGYYPFPEELIPHVTKWLDVPMPESTVILDPCAGEGIAVEAVAEKLSVLKGNLLCAELDDARARSCRERGLNTIVGDALREIHIPQTGCSLLWLNPPYDTGTSFGFARRLETNFLSRFGRTIARGGVLAFIVPFKILHMREYEGFPDAYKNIRILKFPGDDDRFGQCVVLATRMQGKTEQERNNWQKQLANPMSILDDPTHLYRVPGVQLPVDLHKKFYSDFLSQDMLNELCAQPIVKAAHSVDVQLSDHCLKPLMPLRVGHQALVLATGAFDGVYKAPETGNTIVVLGKTHAVTTTTMETDGDSERRVERMSPQCRVTAWDLTESEELGEPVLYDYV